MSLRHLGIALVFCGLLVWLVSLDTPGDIGLQPNAELVRGQDFATLKITVDATMTDPVRQTITNNVIDSVLRAEGDLERSKKPEVCADYAGESTTITVELAYK